MAGDSCSQERPKNTECSGGGSASGPLEHFQKMIPNALAYAKEAKTNGKKVAGIYCEYTPRELFFAADVIPILMCGGQESTVSEAEKELPSNLCPLIKSSYGHALLKTNPFMEMADILVAETTCDGKKKMYELLEDDYQMYILELPQKPDTEIAFTHWFEEIKLLKKRIEELTGQVIDDDSLLKAINRMNEERDLRREIAYLAATNPPLLSGNEVLLAKSSLSLIPCDIAAYRGIIDWAKNRPSPYSSRPKTLLTGVPIPHGAEKVINILEDCGAVVVAQENCTGLKPIMDNISTEGNLLENIARKYFTMPCPCMTPNTDRIELLSKLIEDFRPDGIIDLVWQACHTFNVEAEFIRRRAIDQFDIPYLKLETDYSPSDKSQLSVRIEAFLEMCRPKTAANL